MASFPTFYKPADPDTFSIHQVPQAFFNEQEKPWNQYATEFMTFQKQKQEQDQYQEAMEYKERLKEAFAPKENQPPMTMDEAIETISPIMMEYGKMEEWFEMQRQNETRERQQHLDDATILSVAKTIRNASGDDYLVNKYLKSVGKEEYIGMDFLEQGKRFVFDNNLWMENPDGSMEIIKYGSDPRDKPKYQTWYKRGTGQPRKVDINQQSDMDNAYINNYDPPRQPQSMSQMLMQQMMGIGSPFLQQYMQNNPEMMNMPVLGGGMSVGMGGRPEYRGGPAGIPQPPRQLVPDMGSTPMPQGKSPPPGQESRAAKTPEVVNRQKDWEAQMTQKIQEESQARGARARIIRKKPGR